MLGGLAASDAADFRAHLLGCPTCRRRVAELRSAIAEGQLELHHQPIVRVADGETVVVRYARRLTVADPAGQERTFWTTGTDVTVSVSIVDTEGVEVVHCDITTWVTPK